MKEFMVYVVLRGRGGRCGWATRSGSIVGDPAVAHIFVEDLNETMEWARNIDPEIVGAYAFERIPERRGR